MRRTIGVRQPCKRTKAQGRNGPSATVLEDTDRRRERSPEVEANSSPAERFCRSHFSPQAFGHPDENQSGRTRGTNGTWARTGRDAALRGRGSNRRPLSRVALGATRDVHPSAGANLRRERTPGAPSGDGRGKTCVARPGSASSRTGSGTPREEGANWRMTRVGRRTGSEGARVAGSFASVSGSGSRSSTRRAAADRTSGSVPPVAPARMIEELRQKQDNKPSTRRPLRRCLRCRRASDGFGWNVLGRGSATRASSQHVR